MKITCYLDNLWDKNVEKIFELNDLNGLDVSFGDEKTIRFFIDLKKIKFHISLKIPYFKQI